MRRVPGCPSQTCPLWPYRMGRGAIQEIRHGGHEAQGDVDPGQVVRDFRRRQAEPEPEHIPQGARGEA